MILSLLWSSLLGFSQTIKKKYWYANDSLKGLEKVVEVLQTDTSVIQGSYLHFYQSGDLRVEGTYNNGKPSGQWKYFYESGTLKKEVRYLNDTVSYWTYYYENQAKKKEGKVVHFQKDSIWTYYYENQAVLKKGRFVNDQQHQDWNYYFEDGQTKALAQYTKGMGQYTEYYYQGGVKMSGPVEDNESQGVWSYYYPDGHLKAQGYESGGLKNGKWEYYYQNDTLASSGNYVQGTKQGEWQFFHPNGALSSEGLMSDGYRDGYWNLYHQNGSLKAEASLTEGTGTYVEYHQNKKVKVRGALQSDLYHGQWTYYFDDGTLEAEAHYTQGQGDYKGYYHSGELKMKGKVEGGQQVGTWELYNKEEEVVGYYKLIPIDQDGNSKEVQVAAADDPAALLPTDTIVSHKLPDFHVRKKQFYNPFKPKNREGKGIIISFNPFATLFTQLPISIEYFIQERLGHELRYTWARSPFYLNHANASDSTMFDRGFKVDFRQKFYGKYRQDRGMFYLAHEVRYSRTNFYFNSNSTQAPDRLLDQQFEYSIQVGDRLLRNIKEGGLTFDFYLGVGVAYRLQKADIRTSSLVFFKENYPKELALNPRIGISIGYLF